jgi:hypothetical protein
MPLESTDNTEHFVPRLAGFFFMLYSVNCKANHYPSAVFGCHCVEGEFSKWYSV